MSYRIWQIHELILIRHVHGMRSSSKSVRRAGHPRYVGDRGCPLGTGLVRPMWHANGMAGRTNLLAPSVIGISSAVEVRTMLLREGVRRA